MRNYLTLREAAALTGMSPRASYELCRTCVILARSVRARRRVHRDDVALLALRRLKSRVG